MDMFEKANKQADKDKEIKPIDKVDFKNKILEIVSYMEAKAETDGSIKEILKYLKEKYGIKNTIARSVATIIFKQNLEEVEDKNNAIKTLLDEVI
jgi:hypothetical protein